MAIPDSPRLKRSYWRGLVAGIAAYLLSIVILSALYWVIRPFVWAALYGVPYSPPAGPYDPNSGEWLFFQIFGFLSAMAGGAATIRWSSQRRSYAPLATLLAIAIPLILLGLAMGKAPAHTSLWRFGFSLVELPLGLICGAALFYVFEIRGTDAGPRL